MVGRQTENVNTGWYAQPLMLLALVFLVLILLVLVLLGIVPFFLMGQEIMGGILN